MGDLYMDNIMDYYKNPRNKGTLENSTSKHEGKNVSCGDQIAVSVQIENGILKNAKYDGVGCAVSQAATDMLLDEIIGKKVEDIMKIKKEFILEMLGIELGPVRLKCALLGLETLQKAINKL